MSLTTGSILKCYNHDTNGEPIVQIIDIKKIASGNGVARYRLVISDSVHYQQAMLATQLNHLIEQRQIQPFSVVQLKEYICNVVANRRIVIVLRLDVVQDQNPGAIIGNPANVDTAAAQRPAPQQSTPAPTPAPQRAPQQSNQNSYQNQNQNQNRSSFQSNSNSNSSYNKPKQNNFGPSSYGNQMGKQPEQQNFHPIASLNPYRNRWTIKGRVTHKSDMRTWTNARGDGKLFSVELLDAEGGQIKATMFNEAADKFYPIFQQDKVYVISRGNLKLANKKWNRLPNEYELTLNADAEVSFFGEDTSIMKQKFDFVSIERLEQIQPNEFVDLLGVVQSVSALNTLTSNKTGRELKKRTISLTDQSLMSVDLTLWGESAENYTESDLANNPVLAVKACKVSDYGGRSVNSGFSSVLFVNPDLKEATELRTWYETKGSSATVKSISQSRSGGGPAPRKTFSDIKDENMGFNGQAEWISVRSTITFFQHDPEKPPWYNACPSDTCQKKVNPDENNGWYCEKCSKTYDTFDPRYILRLMACDGTSSEWLTAFNDSAEKLLGKTAQELLQIKEEDNLALFESIFQEANFKSYILKIRVKVESNEDAMQVKCHLVGATPIDFKTESQFLLDAINAF